MGWWEEAVQVFDFSNKNWAAFAGAVNAVDESQYKPLWNYCNPDGDAALTTAELTDAGVIIAAFDSNRDGKLESGELTTWRSTMEGMMGQWDWKPTPEMQACFANAWKHGDQNGNLADGTRHEIALFTLGSWNCLL